MRSYVVVLAAESDVRFRDEPLPFVADNVSTPIGSVRLIFRTRYADEGFAAAIPREMWVDARGETSDEASLNDVVNAYTQAAANLLPVLAVSANAWVGDIEPKLAYDATPHATSREYFQNFVPEVRGSMPPTRRIVDVPATVALFDAVLAHAQRDRLARAMAQYATALGHWLPGRETMALAHLYIGMEALTPVARARELARQGVSDEELADAWGLRLEGNLGWMLDAEVRRRVLFRGDQATARTAQKARNGFTHSFLDFKDVRDLSEPIVETTAEYLRDAIFDLSDADPDARKTLTESPFAKPLHAYLKRYMWGRLVGEGEDLAAPAQEYPILEWRSGIKSFERNPEEPDRFRAQPSDTFTLKAGPGIQFQPVRWEFWAAASSGASIEGPETIDLERGDSLRPLLADVDKALMGVGSGVAAERPSFDVDVLVMFDLCRSGVRAIRQLVSSNLSREAARLSGSIFREALVLLECAAVSRDERGEIVLGRRLSRLSELEEIVRTAGDLGDDDVSAELAALDEQRAQLREFARVVGLNLDFWEADDAALAKKHGVEAEYVELRLVEQLGRDTAGRLSGGTPTEPVMVGAPGGEAALLARPATLLGVASALRAAVAVATIFEWDVPPGLALLETRLAEERASDAN